MRVKYSIVGIIFLIIPCLLLAGDIHLSGEISDITVIEEENVYLDGDLHITEDGQITFINCTIYYNKQDKNGNPAFPDNVVTLLVDGCLKAENSTFTSTSCELKESGTIQIHLTQSASLNTRLTDCTFYNFGRQGNAGAQQSSSLLITNSSTPFVIQNNQFYSTGRTSVRYIESSQRLENNSFLSSDSCEGDNNEAFSLVVEDSRLKVSNCRFIGEDSIEVSNSIVEVRHSLFEHQENQRIILTEQTCELDVRFNTFTGLNQDNISAVFDLSPATAFSFLPYQTNDISNDPLLFTNLLLSRDTVIQDLETLRIGFGLVNWCSAAPPPTWHINDSVTGQSYEALEELSFGSPGRQEIILTISSFNDPSCQVLPESSWPTSGITVLPNDGTYDVIQIDEPAFGQPGNGTFLPVFRVDEPVEIIGSAGGSYKLEFHRGIITPDMGGDIQVGWTGISTNVTRDMRSVLLGTTTFSESGTYTIRLSESDHADHAVYTYVDVYETTAANCDENLRYATIFNSIEYSGITVCMSGIVTVAPDVILTLTNVHLYYERLTISDSAELIMSGSFLYHDVPPGMLFKPYAQIDINGTATITNSTFLSTTDCDSSERGKAILLFSDTANEASLIQTSKFYDSVPTFQARQSSLNILGPQPFTIGYNYFYTSSTPSIYMNNGSIVLEGDAFYDYDPCNPMLSYASNLDIKNSSLTIRKARFPQPQDGGILAYQSDIDLKGCNFTGFSDTVRASLNSHIDFRENIHPFSPPLASFSITPDSTLIFLPQVFSPNGINHNFFINRTNSLIHQEPLKISFDVTNDSLLGWQIGLNEYGNPYCSGNTQHGYGEFIDFRVFPLPSQPVKFRSLSQQYYVTYANFAGLQYQMFSGNYFDIVYPPLGTVEDSEELPTFEVGQPIPIRGTATGAYDLLSHPYLVGAGTESLGLTGWSPIPMVSGQYNLLGEATFAETGIYTIKMNDADADDDFSEHAVYTYVRIVPEGTLQELTSQIVAPLDEELISNTKGYSLQASAIDVIGVADWPSTSGSYSLEYRGTDAQWTPLDVWREVTLYPQDADQPSAASRLLGSIPIPGLTGQFCEVRLTVYDGSVVKESYTRFSYDHLEPEDLIVRADWDLALVPPLGLDPALHPYREILYTLSLPYQLFSLEESLDVLFTLKGYNIDGTPNGQEVILSNHQSLSGGDHVFSWNGTDGSGNPIIDGIFYPYIETRHPNGAWVVLDLNESLNHQVVLDKDDPEGEIESPQQGDVVTNVLFDPLFHVETNTLEIWGTVYDANYSEHHLEIGFVDNVTPCDQQTSNEWIALPQPQTFIPLEDPQLLSYYTFNQSDNLFPKYLKIRLTVYDLAEKSTTSEVCFSVDLFHTSTVPEENEVYAPGDDFATIISYVPTLPIPYCYQYSLVHTNINLNPEDITFDNTHEYELFLAPEQRSYLIEDPYEDFWYVPDEAPNGFYHLRVYTYNYDSTAGICLDSESDLLNTLDYTLNLFDFGPLQMYPECENADNQDLLSVFRPFGGDKLSFNIEPGDLLDGASEAFVAFYMQSILTPCVRLVGLPVQYVKEGDPEITFLWDGVIKDDSLFNGEGSPWEEPEDWPGPGEWKPECLCRYGSQGEYVSGSKCYGDLCVGDLYYQNLWPIFYIYPITDYYLKVINVTNVRPAFDQIVISQAPVPVNNNLIHAIDHYYSPVATPVNQLKPFIVAFTLSEEASVTITVNKGHELWKDVYIASEYLLDYCNLTDSACGALDNNNDFPYNCCVPVIRTGELIEGGGDLLTVRVFATAVDDGSTSLYHYRHIKIYY